MRTCPSSCDDQLSSLVGTPCAALLASRSSDEPATIWGYVTAVNLKVLLLPAMRQPYRPNKVHGSSYDGEAVGAFLIVASGETSCDIIERG